MNELRRRLDSLDLEETGRALHDQIVELYPICRSLTGEGLRETLRWVGRQIPLEMHEVASGTKVLDWTVPPEWNVREAYIKDAAGERIVDFRTLNLHIVGYSGPVHSTLSRSQLDEHLHSLPDHPNLVPYRTSFYEEGWGFCLSHRQRLALEEGHYEVRIDSTLDKGSLSYGECVLPGDTDDEVLISTHACHPSLANDNLSGIVVATRIAQVLAAVRHRYTYRFLVLPSTIGAITWLARNEERVGRVKHGFVLAGVGDGGAITYKRSRRRADEVNRAFEYVLDLGGEPHRVIDFEPFGYDERQFCSPGFDMPVGSLSRTPHGTYPEYHTSADNPDFVQPAALSDSLAKALAALAVLEGNGRYVNLKPKGEPQLGRRGMYKPHGTSPETQSAQRALLWVLSASDGSSDLLDVASRARMPFSQIEDAARSLLDAGLIAPAATD